MSATPERVAVETPSGNVRTGEVLETIDVAAVDRPGVERLYRVQIENTTLRVDPADCVT